MSRHPVPGGRAEAADYKKELLGHLGLGADASDQDVEVAHDGLVEFLDQAPHDVKSWAAARTASVDEAFALLSGPEADLVPSAAVAVMAQDALEQAPQSSPAASPTPAPVAAVVTPAVPAPVSEPVPATSPKPARNRILMVAVPVVVVAAVVGVFFMGKTSSAVPGISGTPTTAATTAASGDPTTVPVDPAKVAALTKKVAANPKDTVSLLAIGDIYFAAGDYTNAAVWENKVVAVDPKNQVGLLSYGAAEFNLGQNAAAKKSWLVAAGLYPNVAEVHYDLGFLYMSQTPPDTADMNAEWNKVIAIDPNSTLAQTVKSHLGTATASPVFRTAGHHVGGVSGRMSL